MDDHALTDDFTRIRGIGTGIERRLHAAGVSTYRDLAGLPAERLAEITGLSAERVARQGLVEQAHELAGLDPAPRQGLARSPADGRQRPEAFTLRLLLDDRGKVQYTQAVHVRSGSTRTWKDWPTDELLEFVSEHAAIGGARRRPEVTPAAQPHGSELAPRATGRALAVAVASASPPTRPLGRLRLLSAEGSPAAPADPTVTLPAGQPLTVRAALELEDASMADRRPLGYTATVHAKGLDDPRRRRLGVSRGTARPGSTVIEVRTSGLPAGIHRLDTDVVLHDPTMDQPATFLVASSWVEVLD